MTLSSQSLLRDAECLDIALNVRDTHTGMHCSRVEGLCMEMGRRFKLSKRELELLRVAARLHDVGKIGIPDHILLKPGKLTPDEWAIMKHHSVLGAEISQAVHHKEATEIARVIRHHHEGFNGQGYPDGLAGEAIPFCSRIITVVDAYDAMTMTRPYHASRNHEAVMSILEEESGSKIDPYFFSHFATVIKDSDYRAA